MTITFQEFINECLTNPSFLIITVLISGVILVNGWTDAPNAIATCVSTRCLSPKKSIIMAAVFNFLGVFTMTLINSTVAQTIFNMVDFGGDASSALTALCAALVAIVTWAVAAWFFGIPTSESHALIAGLSGAAIALQGGISGINGSEWIKVIYGLVMSTVLGFGMGFGITKIIELICKNIQRQKTIKFFKATQIVGGASMAFMHGAQDGQKFMGVFLLGTSLASGYIGAQTFEIPIWLIILCSGLMTLGTSIGGYKIIKTVGMGMVKLEVYQGAAADISSATSLFIASFLGIPVSTTHTKTTAIMGVGASRRLSNVNWSVVKEMVLAWILTFPGCGILGYLATLVFTKIL
ncbi:MAG: inorganic phosphate transporter [Clostridiales bacterium]|nr:inorganic phosphate transporter [Clostridiales bacterium]